MGVCFLECKLNYYINIYIFLLFLTFFVAAAKTTAHHHTNGNHDGLRDKAFNHDLYSGGTKGRQMAKIK